MGNHSCWLCLMIWSLTGTVICANIQSVIGKPQCKDPNKRDPVIGYSSLYGALNASDVVWFNQEWAFRSYGPLSKFTLYKAWYYDGEWHDPGELKGLQTWYGRGTWLYSARDDLLIGANRPHFPKNCTLYKDEAIVRVEIQWDHIMRWFNFTTNLGRGFAWGFDKVPGTRKVVVDAPAPGAYVAAFRGYEGKPLPKEQGGFKDRYISQLGVVWAQRECQKATQQQQNGHQGNRTNGKPTQPGRRTQHRQQALTG